MRIAAALLAFLVCLCVSQARADQLCGPISGFTSHSRQVTNPATGNSYVTDGRGCTTITNASDIKFFNSQGYTNQTTILITTGGSASMNVRNYGAVCDGVTDDTVAINAAMAANQAATIPAATCFSSTGITVPPGHVLQGAAFSVPGPADVTGSSVIQCPSTLAGACVTLGQLNSFGSTILKNIIVAGKGTPSGGSTGVLIQDGQQVLLEDVFTHSFDYGFHWLAHPSPPGAGISSTCTGCFTGAIRVSHIWFDSWAELLITQSRFGQNGPADIAGADFIRVSGGVAGTAGGPNTLEVSNSQFNHGGGGIAGALMHFLNLGAGGVGPIDAREFQFSNIHVENLTNGIISDATWNTIDRMSLSNFRFNQAGAPFLSLDAATTISSWSIVNSYFAGSFITPATQGVAGLQMTNSLVDGAFTLTGNGGSTAGITNNTFGGAVTFNGLWSNNLGFVDNATLSTFTNNATGNVFISDTNKGFALLGFSLDPTGIGLATLRGAPGADTYFNMRTATSSHNLLMQFWDGSDIKWIVQKDTTNTFGIYDYANANFPLTVTPSGVTTIGEIGKNLQVGGNVVGPITITSSISDTYLNLQTNNTGSHDLLQFFDGTTLKWVVQKDATNSLTILDNNSGLFPLSITPSGVVTIGETGVDLQLGAGTGHVRAAGTAPTPTSCGGGSPTVTGDDKAGLVTLGTTATGCVITFARAYTSTPYCTASWQTQLTSMSYTISSTALALTQSSASGNKVNYVCFAQSGG